VFHAAVSLQQGFHELDFRFEVRGDGDEFLFAHHGLSLSDLSATLDLRSLGSTFYMVDARYPFTLTEAIADRRAFDQGYGGEPVVSADHYLRFDLLQLARFFRSTQADTLLDCSLIGVSGDAPPPPELEDRLRDARERGGGPALLGPWHVSWLATHDNHFFRMVGRPIRLLQTLIAESIRGFFHHVYSHPYPPLPEGLVDHLLAEYHTAPLLCFPTDWHQGREAAGAVMHDSQAIRALLETAHSSWIAYQLNPPAHLVGRALLVSYDFRTATWSWEC
jgi:hypothetical protein